MYVLLIFTYLYEILIFMKLKRMKVLRADRALSHMDIAERTHISYSRIVRIENGYVLASAEERADLARLFQSTVAGLFPERTQEASPA